MMMVGILRGGKRFCVKLAIESCTGAALSTATGGGDLRIFVRAGCREHASAGSAHSINTIHLVA